MNKDFLLTLTGSPVDAVQTKPRKREWVLMFLVVLLAGYIEGRDADTEVKIAQEAKQKADERYAELQHPLPWDAVVIQSGTPGELPKARFYVSTRADK